MSLSQRYMEFQQMLAFRGCSVDFYMPVAKLYIIISMIKKLVNFPDETIEIKHKQMLITHDPYPHHRPLRKIG
jgi:hypothetical protein